jgi:acetyl-CoA synthetase
VGRRLVKPIVPAGSSYEEVCSAFTWRIPQRFNIGVACADAHRPGDVAIVEVAAHDVYEWTFGDLTERSNRLANALAALGVGCGDRIAFLLPQGMAAAVAHMAVYKLGAVALPLSALFGRDALHHRLGDSGARLVLADPPTDVVTEVAGELGVEVVDGAGIERLLADGSPRFDPADTAADDPAYLIYTSGTTATPKGVLHSHRSLLGHLPCIELGYDDFPGNGDRMWTPADWSWIGALMDAVLPALLYGVPIVAARRDRFDPEWAARLIEGQGVRNAFLPPTALRLMKAADVFIAPGSLRSVISGGETLGADTLEWAGERLGVTIAEIYGQTEANLLVGNAPSLFPIRPGSMGRPYPGHDVVVVDADGEVVAPGEDGEIALRVPDPVAFLEYLNAPEATAEKTRGGLLRTGDVARRDDDNYLWFVGRTDDLIMSAGYRISPLEVEACLHRHEAVAAVAVVGARDELRGQIVKAYVVAAPSAEPGEELGQELQAFVRERLAAYEYPREIEFLDELPLTVTGKIRRSELAARAAK